MITVGIFVFLFTEVMTTYIAKFAPNFLAIVLFVSITTYLTFIGPNFFSYFDYVLIWMQMWALEIKV